MANHAQLAANAAASGASSVLVDISTTDHVFAPGKLPKCLLVEGTGNIVLEYHDGTQDTYNGVPAWTQLNLGPLKVIRALTTATRIHAYF